MLKPHISFSELKDWNFCPYYHNLVHFQKVKGFRGNVFTAFGNAIHDTCEKTLTEDLKDPYGFFADRFVNVLNESPKVKDVRGTNNCNLFIQELKKNNVLLENDLLYNQLTIVILDNIQLHNHYKNSLIYYC